ncbi:nitroreductase family protein [Desulfovibrio litoralis]|uniref:Nitroreductase n=1 Tax=Desulfovibrio litoralis DSM 11393 TaxID=1121455 RepID=A0A1M7TK67_9BACT|nr:nitroreductase family protein [Desulfovibrio litoralis]SHN71028.1 Nitroreductase [Desulfovibrio litoralis DSM 11393]
MMINFKVDQETCISCGLCVEDCPQNCIEMKKIPVLAQPQACIACQHCLAICPVGAISIFGLDPKNSTELIGSLPDLKSMTALVQGRRSYRHYEGRNVEPSLIYDLINTVVYAPTGCNAQQVLFTVIKEKEKLADFREWLIAELAKVYQLPEYQKLPGARFMHAVVDSWRNNKEDILFRSAPHVMITSAPPTAPCAREDGVLALSYFELLSQSAGLGTVWDGIVYLTMQYFVPHAKEYLGIPNDHVLGYAMAFGYPTVKYPRAVQRKPIKINYV